LIVNNLS